MSETISAVTLLVLLLGSSVVKGTQGENVPTTSAYDGQPQSTQTFSSDQNSTLVTDLPHYGYQRETVRNNSSSKRQGGKNLEQVVFQLLQEGNSTKEQASFEDSDPSDNIDLLTNEMKEALANKTNMMNISQIITYSDGGKIKIKDLIATEEYTEVSKAINKNEAVVQITGLENIPCNELLSIEVKSGRLHADGSLQSLDDNMIYPPGYFWRTSNNSYRGCYCSLRPCVRKCCSADKILIGEECEPSESKFLHPFNPNYTDEVGEYPRLVYGVPCKESMYMLEPEDEQDKHYLYSNGSLYVTFENEYLDSTQFCLDVVEERGGIFIYQCTANENVLQIERGIHYAIGMIICIPFLAAAFIAYALLPELRTLHGKCLMCNVGCNLVGYVSLVVIQIWQDDFTDITCTIFAMIAFFVNLTSFTWLSAICFDIWWTFSNFLPSRDGTKQDRKKFLFYSAYSWGIPAVILIIAIIMDFSPGIPDHHIKPEFGKEKCWLSTPQAWMAYFFGPIAIIMFGNLVLFIITAVKIKHIKRETAMLKNNESQRHKNDNKKQSKLYFNLFILMGISRMVVMIAWAVLIVEGLSGIVYMWIIIHLLEVGMCVIFIGQRQFWTRLLQAISCCKYFSKSKESSPQESGSSNTTTVTVETNEGAIEMTKVNSSSTKSEEP